MPEPQGEPLSFDDAQILRLESDAIKGHTGKVLVVEPAAGSDPMNAGRLRERVAERIEGLPRLRERVDAGDHDEPRWVPAEVDLDWHITAHEAPKPLADEGFRAIAGEILAERLDHDRPLWRFDVVPLAEGRTGLVGRIHHAMADGVSAIKTVGELLWDEAQDAPTPGRRGAAANAKSPSPAAEHHERPLLVRLPGALRRELKPGADTVLDRHIGSGREVAWTVFPLERLRAIGHAGEHHATVNDVVLAVVAGALHRWLGERPSAPATLRAQIPVSMHQRDDDPGSGNRDSFFNIDLPIAEPDPVRRLSAISGETEERKLDHDAETLYSFFHALSRFGPLYRGVTRVVSGPREFALSVSNVPGPRARPTICGHELREFCSFAEPADRHALRVAVISLGGDLAFGLCSDPEAIDGLDLLAEAVEQSVAELETALQV